MPENKRRAINSPNPRSNPTRLDQFGREGEIPDTELEALNATYNEVPSMRVTTIEEKPDEEE